VIFDYSIKIVTTQDLLKGLPLQTIDDWAIFYGYSKKALYRTKMDVYL